MDKQKAAKQLINQVLAFLLDNAYIEDDIFAKDDIEQLQDIAYGNIEALEKIRQAESLATK